MHLDDARDQGLRSKELQLELLAGKRGCSLKSPKVRFNAIQKQRLVLDPCPIKIINIRPLHWSFESLQIEPSDIAVKALS